MRKTLIAVNIRQAFIDNILLNQYHHNTVALSSRMGDTRQREILLSFSDAGLGFALVIQLFWLPLLCYNDHTDSDHLDHLTQVNIVHTVDHCKTKIHQMLKNSFMHNFTGKCIWESENKFIELPPKPN